MFETKKRLVYGTTEKATMASVVLVFAGARVVFPSRPLQASPVVRCSLPARPACLGGSERQRVWLKAEGDGEAAPQARQRARGAVAMRVQGVAAHGFRRDSRCLAALPLVLAKRAGWAGRSTLAALKSADE